MKILFICTHNRCRSILFEAISNQLGEGHLIARSAGSQPAGEVHPLTLKYLQQAGFSSTGLRSQSWDDFADFAPDVVITVCDRAAGESCPLYFGNSLKVHWGLSDPSGVTGSDTEVAKAFTDCINEIVRRVNQLTVLAASGVSGPELATELKQLGANT